MKNERVSAGLYVHVPFCIAKCPYCDFTSIPDLNRIPIWLDAILLEIDRAPAASQQIDTVYIGGGTPSLLPKSALSRLFDGIHARFQLSSSAEITLEANPENVSLANLQFWESLQINRISLGIQALNRHDLRFLGRHHTPSDALEACRLVRNTSHMTLSVDLMFGLPGQTSSAWLRTLARTVRLQPDHLSCYQLDPVPGTPLMKRIHAGKVRELPEIRQKRLFRATSRFLERTGYGQYEISNFCQKPESECRHNANYWNHTPYLGVGPSAHSFDGRTRWWNVKPIGLYAKRLQQGISAEDGRETLDDTQLRLEELALGLRTKRGVTIETVRWFDPDLERTRKLIEAGWVEACHGRIHATLDGFCLADRLPIDIIGNSLDDPGHER